jgi:hypothetical protein
MKIVGNVGNKNNYGILSLIANGAEELLLPVRTVADGTPIVADRDGETDLTLENAFEFIDDLASVILDIKPKYNFEKIIQIIVKFEKRRQRL